MNNQKVYLYLELEDAELDIVPLYSMFSKGKCFGSPVGDTYYTYVEDDIKIARTRKEAYFQARLEYDAVGENVVYGRLGGRRGDADAGSARHAQAYGSRTGFACDRHAERLQNPARMRRKTR